MMKETFERVCDYCRKINRYLGGKGPKPPTLEEAAIKVMKKDCAGPAGKGHVQESEDLEHLKKTVERTKDSVEREIKSLTESEDKQERMTDLYVFNDQLYDLYSALHVQDREIIREAYKSAKKGTLEFLKSSRKEFAKEEKRFLFRWKMARHLRSLFVLTAFFAFIFSFRNPAYTFLLIPYALVAVVFVIPALTLWIRNFKEKAVIAHEKADPAFAKQALQFLKESSSLQHLKVLLDEPSLDPDYQSQYIDFLIDLGKTCGWIDTKPDHIEAKREKYQEALNEAYSFNPMMYSQEFLKDWQVLFENLQKEIKKHFGNNARVFRNKSVKNPAYFLLCFKDFQESETAEKMKKFLHKL